MGRLKCIFRVPECYNAEVFGDGATPCHLVYVELFTKTPNSAAPSHHGYHTVRPDRYGSDHRGEKMGVVMPLDQLYRACQLLPKFFGPVNRSWTTHNVLDNADIFHINPYRDLESFHTIHWFLVSFLLLAFILEAWNLLAWSPLLCTPIPTFLDDLPVFLWQCYLRPTFANVFDSLLYPPSLHPTNYKFLNAQNLLSSQPFEFELKYGWKVRPPHWLSAYRYFMADIKGKTIYHYFYHLLRIQVVQRVKYWMVMMGTLHPAWKYTLTTMMKVDPPLLKYPPWNPSITIRHSVQVAMRRKNPPQSQKNNLHKRKLVAPPTLHRRKVKRKLLWYKGL